MLPRLVAVLLLAGTAGAHGLPGWGSGVARADGDPASDVLLGQDVFLPYSPISETVQRRLYAITAASQRAGYPLRIALIGARTDLGVIPTLFGRPETYARFLSAELTGVVNGPVLVVMPAGFGLAAGGNARSVASLGQIRIGPGADGLGLAAIAAAGRLAASAGHPLPADAASSALSLGASAATVRHALTAIVVMALLAALAIGAALLARSRRALGRDC
jgi:hypothetical protein